MENRALPPSVANYNLYGEFEDLPDVAHVETISARSKLTDWQFPAHRHGRLHQVLLFEKGEGTVDLEGRKFPLKPVLGVNVPTGAVHGYQFKPGSEGMVITLTTEMADKALEPSQGLRDVLSRPAVVSADAQLIGAVRQIADEYGRRDFARAQILHGLSGFLLGQMARLVARETGIVHQAEEEGRFRAFESLLESHYADHWRVADYAAEMGITPVHLTRIAKAATGKSASALIDERIVREARRSLVYTNLPISRIAYSLGFSDPAYFSRVFTRVTGMAPSRVRG